MMMNLKNNEIIDLNDSKRQTNLISTIRKFDDRTISYNKAKQNLVGAANNYFEPHF
jgi:hypothetical protein